VPAVESARLNFVSSCARRVTLVDDRQAGSGNTRVGFRRRNACRIVATARHCFSGGDAHLVIRVGRFRPGNRWCGRELVLILPDRAVRSACRWAVRPRTLCACRARVGRLVDLQQLPDAVLARTSATGGFSSPTNCAATLCRRPHTPLPTPLTRHTSTSSHPEIAPSIAAVSYQQFPSLYQIAARMLPIFVARHSFLVTHKCITGCY
jgi:hypothetical protein